MAGYSRGGEDAYPTLCGAVVRSPVYRLDTYFYIRDRHRLARNWCPECEAGLTPLDELANTDL